MRSSLVIWAGMLLCASLPIVADAIKQTKAPFEDKFRQLDADLPTPNIYRNAAGEPGHAYWQQKVDYQIDARLDEDKQRLEAEVKIHYHNQSPDTLRYLWLQLDQNRFRPDSMGMLAEPFTGTESSIQQWGQPATGKAKIGLRSLNLLQFQADHQLGYSLNRVVDDKGRELTYVVVGTNMRIDLPDPVKPGQSFEFSIDYDYQIVDGKAMQARGGYEHFPDDAREGGNHIFFLAQWFPRLHAYTDYEAWTNREFQGRGEFTLEFGNYDLRLTVPADHIVASSGVLQNPDKVLSKTQRERLKKAKNAKRPVYIVTPEEALENEKQATSKTKTWHFRADNVRDVAWASSRKFMWDAKGYEQGGNIQPEVMAMSFFPKEANPLWEKYSTESIIHTMEVYSRFAFDYPYPTAQSVHGVIGGGMEYPMITLNGPRPKLQKDGTRTYSLGTKLRLIGLVIHEIGHIYFPMVVNSDERQWTWMDEGINSFLDGVAGREWDPDIPWGVEPRDIVDYMRSENQVPIMTNSESILQFGPNAYTKPAAALNILRETILGRELFDYAFKEYSRRWMFKRPTPADFFRTMEEASGVDLDWFWRGWFYSTDHVDISLDRVYELKLDTENPDIDFARDRQDEAKKPDSQTVLRNKMQGLELWVDKNPDVRDFHDDNDRFTVTNKDRNKYQELIESLEPWERRVFERAVEEDKKYYVLDFSNIGGLVMPIILQLGFEDGTEQELRLPAEIWQKNPKRVMKLLVFDKPLKEILVDPHWETADVDIENNYYPRKIIPSRLEMYRQKKRSGRHFKDLMHDAKTKLKSDKDSKE